MTFALRNTTSRWGGIAKLFHWVIVILIIVQYVLANQAADLPLGLRKLVVLAQHKSFGMTILAIAVLRLVWRWANPVPALPANMKAWERFGAHVSHWALYGLLFALPLSGWLMSSAKNYTVSWFNLFAFPDLVAADDAVYNAMLGTHHVLAKVLFAVAVLHMLAALQHHFLKKDDVLRDMLPFSRSRSHS